MLPNHGNGDNDDDKKEAPRSEQEISETIYTDRVAELIKTGKWEALNSKIEELTYLDIWNDNLAYVFALQKETDLKPFLDNLFLIDAMYLEEITSTLVKMPQHASQLLFAIQKLNSRGVNSDPNREAENLDLLLNHPAEANALSSAMIELFKQDHLNEATLLLLDTHPEHAAEIAQAEGKIPKDFKLDTDTMIDLLEFKLLQGEFVSDRQLRNIHQMLEELKKLNILDQDIVFTIAAQQKEDVLTFINRLVTVTRVGLPDDIRHALSTSPATAYQLIKNLKILCEFDPALYRHETVRQAVIEHKPAPLTRLIKEWFSLLREYKCLDDKIKLASISQIAYLDHLVMGARHLQKADILNKETILALLANAPHAEQLGEGLAMLAQDPKLYKASYSFLIEVPNEAKHFAEIYLELKEKIPHLPIEGFSQDVIQAIGKEVLRESFHLTPSQLNHISKNTTLMQNVGSAFIGFANESKMDLPKNLSDTVAQSIADLKSIERTIHSETTRSFLWESSDEAKDDVTEDTYYRVDVDQLRPYKDDFIRFFENMFEEPNFVRKWHDIYSIFAIAFNNINYNQSDLLEIESKTEGDIDLDKLIDWMNEVSEHLNTQREVNHELKESAAIADVKPQSSPTLSQFLDTRYSDNPNLKYLQTLENTPIEDIHLPILYALTKILRRVEPECFYGEDATSACYNALQKEIGRKDPKHTFFQLSPAQIKLFDSIWNEDENHLSHDAKSSPKNPSKQ